MSDRGARTSTVLLMWEFACAFSPIWSRSADLDGGPLDVRDLGLDDALRDDLADWNLRCEVAADPSDLLPVPTSQVAWRSLMTEAFPLAARVQRGLGDDWTVWCLAGGGDGAMRDEGGFRYLRRTSGPQVVLRDGGPIEWTPSSVALALDRFDPDLRREVRAWRSGADGVAPGEHRAQGLELAGRLQAMLPDGRLLWFGGADVPH